jgi:cell filamentation protein
MSKGNFTFAAPSQIPRLMQEFEKKILAKCTPTHYHEIDELAFVLAIVHIELIIIHPFREGNGRVARLLSDLMAFQSNRPPINFGAIDQTKNKKGYDEYILAIQAGVGMGYEPMKKIFRTLLVESM